MGESMIPNPPRPGVCCAVCGDYVSGGDTCAWCRRNPMAVFVSWLKRRLIIS